MFSCVEFIYLCILWLEIYCTYKSTSRQRDLFLSLPVSVINLKNRTDKHRIGVTSDENDKVEFSIFSEV